jgi:ParB family chromosome partitioning protein
VEIARKIGTSETRVSQLLKLITAGEERLVVAVERGDIPLQVAIDIAVLDDEGAQKSLAAAYERGELRGRAIVKARRLVDTRRHSGKGFGRRNKKRAPTREDIVRTYRRETQRQEIMVKKAQICEQRLLFVASALKGLFAQNEFVRLLRAEKLDKLPKYLAGFIGRS